MIKNHTHNNDSGSIHYIFKKILDLGIIKEAFTIIPINLIYIIIIHTGLLVAKIKSCIPRALWQGGQYY